MLEMIKFMEKCKNRRKKGKNEEKKSSNKRNRNNLLDWRRSGGELE